MKIKKQVIFTALLCLFVFVTIPHVNAQQVQSYNPVALEHFKRSLEFLAIGDYYNAIISSNNVIKLDPNSAINYVVRARAYYEMDEYDRAIADCTQAIRLDRNNAAAFHIRGNAHGKKGDTTRAIADWQNALRINPELTEATHNIELARSSLSD